jgi:hypothetical protein
MAKALALHSEGRGFDPEIRNIIIQDFIIQTTSYNFGILKFGILTFGILKFGILTSNHKYVYNDTNVTKVIVPVVLQSCARGSARK